MNGSPPTRRVIDAVELLATATEPRSIAQIADELDASRATMAAVLGELAAAGWVTREPSLGYRLGPAAVGLGRAGHADPAGSVGVLDALRELADATDCGVTLSRFSPDRMTVVAKIHSRSRPVTGLGVGQSLTVAYPAGAAVMARRHPDEQASWLGARGASARRRRDVLDFASARGFVAYRPASTDATLIEALADLLGAVGPMLIDPAVRRSATRQLAELSSRAYRTADFDVPGDLPISYVAAAVGDDLEIQLGVLRSAVTADERRRLSDSLTEAACRVRSLMTTGTGQRTE